MSSYSIDFTGPTDESGTHPDANSIPTNTTVSSIAIKARSRPPRAEESTQSAVKEWVHLHPDGKSNWREPPAKSTDRSSPDRTHTDDQSTEAKTVLESLVGESTFKFVHWHPDNNSKIPASIAEPSHAPKESSRQSAEISATTPSSIMSDVTAWIAKSAQRDPSVTLPVTGLFDLLDSEELRVDAALGLQGSAEDEWLDFVKAMRSMKFCHGQHSVCSHIVYLPLGDRKIPVSINRDSAIDRHPLISLLFTVRVKNGVNQGSALEEPHLHCKQYQWDGQTLDGLTSGSRYTVEGLGGIKPSAFEHVKVFMNEDMTAGWWIGRTEYPKDSSEQTYTYYGLRVDDGRDIQPSAGRG